MFGARCAGPVPSECRPSAAFAMRHVIAGPAGAVGDLAEPLLGQTGVAGSVMRGGQFEQQPASFGRLSSSARVEQL